MKRLLILSGKGGTGKNTVAAAFIHFAKAKAAADCDVDGVSNCADNTRGFAPGPQFLFS